MSANPLVGDSASPHWKKFWIPALFLLTIIGLWLTGALGKSLIHTFLPHDFCFNLNPQLLWTHFTSDLVIAVSYLAISTTLTVLVAKARGEIPFSWMFLSFGAFIIMCGATHLMEVVTLWLPVYWLSANVKVLTALASLTTAIALPPLVPKMLALLRTASLSEQRRIELERAQAVLQAELKSRDLAVDKLAADIAARNRELEENRQRLFVTLQSIGDAVIATDPEGRINFMNGAAETLTGWSGAQARGRSLPEVFHIVNEFTREALESPFEKVKRTRSVVALANHAMLITHDGSEISIDDSGAPILDSEGNMTGVILTFRDISDRRRVEEMRTLLSSIVNSSDDAIVSRDLEGVVTSWNKGAEALYGYTAEEAVGQVLRLGQSAEESERLLLREEGLANTARQHIEVRRTTKDGSAIDVSLTLSPIYDYVGRLIGTAAIGRDITMQKQTEESLRTSEKLAATGRLAATIAHEINNPLEAVMNLLFLIETESTAQTSLHNYALKAQEELGRIVHITRQTLAFYRDTTQPTSVDIYEVAAQILEIYQHDVRHKKLKVELNIAPALAVPGFPGELRQVFSNLIRNAMEAVPAGGSISVEGTRQDDEWVRVAVRDSGPGVPGGDLNRIFEPFYTTKGVNGTGLGLWVSQGIVQKHGGILSVRNLDGAGGAEFEVRLPLRSPLSQT